jgi:putative transposase
MLVIKSHKILLKTNPELEQKFLECSGASRWAYNYGLARKIEDYEKTGENTCDPTGEIVQLKKTPEYAWLKDYPCDIPRTALKSLDMAFKNFFRRLKQGKEKPGFPKFKSKKRSKLAFHMEVIHVRVEGKRVRLSTLGWVGMYEELRFVGRLVGTVCISKTAGRWYASFGIETEIPDPIEKQEKIAVGVDVGIKSLAVLSDGTVFENPKAFYRLEKLLARAQRQLARKKKGSHRHNKAKLRVQKIHKRIADLRANATHNATSFIVSNYDGVAIEDLNVRGMVRNHNLSKAVLDANFGCIHQQLHYKMLWKGGEVRESDRFFASSKTCSVCGAINDNLTLADRVWTCSCGAIHDRDNNAGINLVVDCFGREEKDPIHGGFWTLRINRSNGSNEAPSLDNGQCGVDISYVD